VMLPVGIMSTNAPAPSAITVFGGRARG